MTSRENDLLKVIRIYVDFALLRFVIGSKFSRHFLDQSEVKPKPIVTRSPKFSRAFCRLHVFASSLDLFTGFQVSSVTAQMIGCGLPTLKPSLEYTTH